MKPDAAGHSAPCCRIVEITSENLDEVGEMWESLGFWPHFAENRRWLERAMDRNPGLFLAAQAEGRMVGTVCGAWDGLRGWVYHFGVSADYRNRGVGQTLLDEVERRLQAQGVSQVNLMVYDENPQAVQYYLKRGYERSPVQTLRKRFSGPPPPDRQSG